ncbi:MAG: 5'-methylthioadenosine phosphorylase, partial [uncultured Solirubrobacteraceae bacterium]
GDHRHHHRLGHLRAAALRGRPGAARGDGVGGGARLPRDVRRGRRAPSLAPRRGARPALQPRRPPGQHRRAGEGRGGRGDRRHGVRRRRPVARARLAHLLRRRPLPRQSPARRRDVHLLRRARRQAARPLDLRGPLRARAARRAAGRGAGGGPSDARRRVLRPRRRPALQHEGRGPRARERRRDGDLADRRPGDRPRRGDRAALRAAGLRDRLRQRRRRRGDAGRHPARDDGPLDRRARRRAVRGAAARRRRRARAHGHGVSLRAGL